MGLHLLDKVHLCSPSVAMLLSCGFFVRANARWRRGPRLGAKCSAIL